MIVISDASPVINLANVGHLDLLRQLYTRVIIPEAVYREIVIAGSGRPGAAEVQSSPWIESRRATNYELLDAFKQQLGPGELEAIALAAELGADLLLLDERKARGVAANLGLNIVGLLGVLVEAKRRGFVQSIKPIIDAMIATAGFRVETRLYSTVLQSVGE